MIDPKVLGAEYQAPEVSYELESTRFLNLTYSLYGEDLIIRSKLKNKFFSETKGVYIDIGAFHPFLASNTYLFYGAGWSGVCVDPNPIFSNAFAQLRPRDTFKNIAILNEEKNLYFAEHLKNTGMSNIFENTDSIPEGFGEPLKMRSEKLSSILEKNLNHAQEIDFMSVDAEDHDLNVLQSNNWSRFRPKIICVEEHSSSINHLDKSPTVVYLKSHGYQVFAHVPPNLFFEDKKDT